jgi:uncharacterized integral membrane protein (TIGR00698 family)
VLFVLVAAVASTPWASGPIALAAGIALALLGLTAFEPESKRISKLLVQACVIMLGFRLGIGQLAHAAAEGLLFAVATIGFTLGLGWALGRLLRTSGELATLVNSGTAICGASAIAAVGASMGAAGASMAVATGAIFILNAIGLWALPAIGHALQLSEAQFGTWAGVALHDVASVAAAAGTYHAPGSTTSVAMDTANVVKMTRVLWIIPLAFAAAWSAGRAASDARSRVQIPWFIGLFLLASVLRTLVPDIARVEGTIRTIAATGFQLALFLIGSGLTRATLRAVGWRVLAHATILWIAVAAGSLVAIRAMVS